MSHFPLIIFHETFSEIFNHCVIIFISLPKYFKVFSLFLLKKRVPSSFTKTEKNEICKMLSLSESYQNLLKKFQKQVEQSNKKDHE